MRSQAGGEHARAPGPPGLHHLLLLPLVEAHHIEARVVGLLLSGVGDLRHLDKQKLRNRGVEPLFEPLFSSKRR